MFVLIHLVSNRFTWAAEPAYETMLTRISSFNALFAWSSKSDITIQSYSDEGWLCHSNTDPFSLIQNTVYRACYEATNSKIRSKTVRYPLKCAPAGTAGAHFSGYPTNIEPVALQRASRDQPPHDGWSPLSHWVTQERAATWAFRKLSEAHHLRADSIIQLPSSVPPDFLLHWFWPSTANQMTPHCLLQRHRFGFQPSASGWL